MVRACEVDSSGDGVGEEMGHRSHRQEKAKAKGKPGPGDEWLYCRLGSSSGGRARGKAHEDGPASDKPHSVAVGEWRYSKAKENI